MKILNMDAYRDGGTVCVETDEGEYCIDNRIGTRTVGEIYRGYPTDGKIVDVDIRNTIIEKIQNTDEKQKWRKYALDLLGRKK